MNKKIRELLASAAMKRVAALLVTVGLGAVGYQIDPVACDALAQVLIGVITL